MVVREFKVILQVKRGVLVKKVNLKGARNRADMNCGEEDSSTEYEKGLVWILKARKEV